MEIGDRITRATELQGLTEETLRDNPHLMMAYAEWLSPTGNTAEETAQNVATTIKYLREAARGHLKVA